MDENNRSGLWIRDVTQVIEDAAVRADAADERRTILGINTVAVATDWGFAIFADTDAGLLVPDEVHQESWGAGRVTERFSARACWQATWGVWPGSRWISCCLLFERCWLAGRFRGYGRQQCVGDRSLPVAVAGFEFAIGM